MNIGAIQYGGWDVGAAQYTPQSGGDSYSGDLASSIGFDSEIAGTYSAPDEYEGALSSQITILSSLAGMYVIGGEANLQLVIAGSISGTYVLRGETNANLQINCSISGNYAEPVVHEGSIDSSVVFECSIGGEYVAPVTGELSSEITLISSIAGSYRLNSEIQSQLEISSNINGTYIVPVTGEIDMNIIILGSFGGTYTASLDRIIISPSSAKVAFNKNKQFSILGYDPLNNIIPITDTVVWSITNPADPDATIVDGLFTAGETAGEFAVTATVGLITKDVVVRVLEKIPSTSYRARIAVKVGF